MTETRDFSKNNFVFTTDERASFMDFIKEVDKTDNWEIIPLDSIRVGKAERGISEHETDTANSLIPFCIMTNGKKLPVRPHTWKFIKNQFRNESQIIADMLRAGEYGNVCTMLNSGTHLLKKNVLVLERGKKVEGFFSTEFNHELTESEQIDAVEETLCWTFPAMTFLNGYYDHEFTRVIYQLDEVYPETGSAFCSALSDYWKSTGNPEMLSNAIPYLHFMTGESGMTAMSATAYVSFGNRRIPLGEPITVTHRGCRKATFDRFFEELPNISSLYTKGLQDLSMLASRNVLYPYSCLTHCLKQFRTSVPTKLIKDLASHWRMLFPPDEECTCKALDVFLAISDLTDAAEDRVNTTKRFCNKEMLARMLTMDWSKVDKKAPLRVTGRKFGEIDLYDD